MKLQKSQSKVSEPTVPLKDTKPGDCIRFAQAEFVEALKCELFWMRVDAPEAKDRVRLVNIADGKQLECDGFHRVIIHRAALHIEC